MKYWAVNDEMLLCDATGKEGPIDQFKTEHHKQKSKFNIADKVNKITHWENNDKIGDPEIKNGWKPLLKWSEIEKQLRCEGIDR